MPKENFSDHSVQSDSKAPPVANPPKVFDTPRLHLRVPEISDADWIFNSYAQDPQVVKYLTWKPHQKIEETRDFILNILKRAQSNPKFPYTITRREDKQLLGMLEIRLEGPMMDFGYVLARNYWGQGYMTEAVKAIIQWGLDQKGISRIWSICDIENRASARVMEKAGLVREGVLFRRIIHPNISQEPRDVYCYSVIK